MHITPSITKIFTVGITFSVLLFSSCQSDSKNQEQEIETSYTLNGQVSSDYSGYVFLNYTIPGTSPVKIKDSVLVDNGHFSFTGYIPYAIQGYLNLEPPSQIGWIYVEPGSYKVFLSNQAQEQPNGEMYNFVTLDSVAGSLTADIRRDFRAYYQEIKDLPNFKVLISDTIAGIVTKYPENGFSGKILADNSYLNQNLPPSLTVDLFAKLDTLKQNPEDIILIKDGIQISIKYAEGQPIGDINLEDINGASSSWSDLESEYILIDFWATWCAPCIRKFPAYKTIVNETSREQFAIFSVALEEQKDGWKQMIQQKELTWNHVIDTTAFDGETAARYYLRSIPNNYLIDNKGTIIKANIKPEALSQFLASKKTSK